MAHEGRGDIDQEKKGRPGHQTADTDHHAVNDFMTGWLPRAGAVWWCITSACLLYPTTRCENDARVVNNREESGMNVYPLHRGVRI